MEVSNPSLGLGWLSSSLLKPADPNMIMSVTVIKKPITGGLVPDLVTTLLQNVEALGRMQEHPLRSYLPIYPKSIITNVSLTFSFSLHSIKYSNIQKFNHRLINDINTLLILILNTDGYSCKQSIRG
jgi:hypothetical protein